jgi:hypothetical protein
VPITVGRGGTAAPIHLTHGGDEDMTSTRAAVLAVVSLMWLAAVATAQQMPMASDCDKWIDKINSEVGVRVDEAGFNARVKADEIARMCKEGKMDEAQKTATETMTNLGIKQ